jgi:predicted nuclease of predicted toxin-antitoxin system
LASTKLRLLLEASIENPLADCIIKLAPSAEYVRRMPSLVHAKDSVIYAYAQKTRRIIVDVDGDFKEASYPPGVSNPGIIRFNSARTNYQVRCLIFKRFWQSGLRAQAKNAYTYLTSGPPRIVKG